MDPCIVPLTMEKVLDLEPPHLTHPGILVLYKMLSLCVCVCWVYIIWRGRKDPIKTNEDTPDLMEIKPNGNSNPIFAKPQSQRTKTKSIHNVLGPEDKVTKARPNQFLPTRKPQLNIQIISSECPCVFVWVSCLYELFILIDGVFLGWCHVI
jgi:hypothetical protein